MDAGDASGLEKSSMIVLSKYRFCKWGAFVFCYEKTKDKTRDFFVMGKVRQNIVRIIYFTP